MNTKEVRKLRDQFWKEKVHQLAKPSSLIPSSSDKSVIFNVAGMQPIVPFLMGKPHPNGKRLYNIQRCIRTVDIEEVGDERHLTLFEMMGNWSLGDYFKKESIERSIEFLVEMIGLDKEKLGCSIFGGMIDENGKEILPFDHESKEVLLSNGIPEERIKAIGKKPGEKCDNRRAMGETGPCGPCAEFHYDRGDERGPNDWDIGENDRFIEIRNNVFMSFYQDQNGITPLKNNNIDTGMGLERLMMCKEDAETVFETDIFKHIIDTIQSVTTTNYPPYRKSHTELTDKEKQTTQSFRVVTDHSRAVVFLLMDGVIPSNESRGYVCRRLIRRMYFHLSKIYHNQEAITQKQTSEKIIREIVNAVVGSYDDAYPALRTNILTITKILQKEIQNFQKTINKGKKLLEDIIEKNTSGKIEGKQVFQLYDTFGFPVDLTEEIAQEHGLSIDKAGRKEHMQQAKQKAKNSAKNKFKTDIDWSQYLEGVIPTTFIGRDNQECKNMKIIKDFMVEEQRIIVFDKTPFYAEGGGQKSDSGTLIDSDGKKLQVTQVKKYDGVFLHFVS